MTAPKAVSPADALSYEAPFLIEKLQKDHIVQSAEEAHTLFTEVKRYIVLVCSSDRADWQMYSLRVDEVWHQFVLFTWEYIHFCQHFFGRYIQHNPSNAPDYMEENQPQPVPATAPLPPTTFDDFKKRYQALYGEPLREVWYDEKNVTIQRRIINSNTGALLLKDGTEQGMIDLIGKSGDVLLSLNEFASEALAFIVRTGAFYVRELPGGLTDEEKVALIATLVQVNVLRLAS